MWAGNLFSVLTPVARKLIHRAMIDTHSHIYGPEFTDDIDQVLLRAQAAGVEKILLPNINLDTIQPMLELYHRQPSYLHPMMGLHPEDVKANWREVLHQMEAHLQKPGNPYIAVGEVGLDYYWDKTFYLEQQAALDTQIQWALRYSLPLVIHCREAHQELIATLAPYKGCGLKGIFHCFGGTKRQVQELLAYEGFMLGIGGIVTFKKSTLPNVLTDVPLSRIVMETDSPYLAPVPHRGKRNESSFCVNVLQTLAQIYRLPAQEVSKQTNENAARVFEKLLDGV